MGVPEVMEPHSWKVFDPAHEISELVGKAFWLLGFAIFSTAN
jgi:hypothetical protein